MEKPNQGRSIVLFAIVFLGFLCLVCKYPEVLSYKNPYQKEIRVKK